MTTTIEKQDRITQDRINRQENKIRDRWIKENQNRFAKITTCNIDSSHDIDCTGFSTNDGVALIYRIELKERTESITKYSGSTWIEQKKLKHFRDIWTYSGNAIQCLYAIYFCDGYIEFNLSNRFKIITSEVLYFFCVPQKYCTYGDSKIVNKWFASLIYNHDYGDLMQDYRQKLQNWRYAEYLNHYE
jgi:hypothetical protein